MSAHFDRDSGEIGAGTWCEEKLGVRGLMESALADKAGG